MIAISAGIGDEVGSDVGAAVVAEVDNVLAQCKVCRAWERPQIKPMAKTELSLEINKRLYADIIHYVMDSVRSVALHHFGDWLATIAAWSSESYPAAREFLRIQHPNIKLCLKIR